MTAFCGCCHQITSRLPLLLSVSLCLLVATTGTFLSHVGIVKPLMKDTLNSQGTLTACLYNVPTTWRCVQAISGIILASRPYFSACILLHNTRGWCARLLCNMDTSLMRTLEPVQCFVFVGSIIGYQFTKSADLSMYQSLSHPYLPLFRYERQYIDEAFLYHLVRQDTKHNFSVYFYMLYLVERTPYASLVGPPSLYNYGNYH